jgi:hypothetical protein
MTIGMAMPGMPGPLTLFHEGTRKRVTRKDNSCLKK